MTTDTPTGFAELARSFIREFPEEATPFTNYLRKYREEGRPIHRALFVLTTV